MAKSVWWHVRQTDIPGPGREAQSFMTLPTLEMASCPVPGARAAPFTSHSVAQARPVRPKSSAVTQQQVLSAPRTQQQPQLQPQPALCGHPDAQRRREQAQRRCVLTPSAH